MLRDNCIGTTAVTKRIDDVSLYVEPHLCVPQQCIVATSVPTSNNKYSGDKKKNYIGKVKKSEREREREREWASMTAASPPALRL